jgi:hypothetical protein
MELTIDQEGIRQPLKWVPAPTTEPSSQTAQDVADSVTNNSASSIPTGQWKGPNQNATRHVWGVANVKLLFVRHAGHPLDMTLKQRND